MFQAPRNSHVQPPRAWEHVQKLTLCRQLLQQCCDEYGARHGIRLEIDSRQFTAAFFAWIDAVAHNDDYRQRNPRDFFQFAYGVLLRDLLHEKAVRIVQNPVEDPLENPPGNPVTHAAGHRAAQPPSPDDLAHWWPAGYMLTYFCIGMLKRTVREECGLSLEPADALSQPAVWQSFRENIVEEPGLAIAYFDKFMGIEPNWREPGFVANRPGSARPLKSVRPV
ncbi:hypothetical protein [Paraburkholderia humisilvae]|uniref:Uncharacterized protein n=1 Tax=Paraburkholderia humisilvae TaxID=627669 RepID=A0A6J5E9U6_9BURK|nr:hypothetical protein [Paraburkholderia humisilvae]CAB3762637.1 hypothetical protein LMG29542_04414 [Paraburkholderia humisilvae]